MPGLTAWLTALVNQDGRLQTVAPALERLLMLYRFDAVPGTGDVPAVGALLRVTFRRTLELSAVVRLEKDVD